MHHPEADGAAPHTHAAASPASQPQPQLGASRRRGGPRRELPSHASRRARQATSSSSISSESWPPREAAGGGRHTTHRCDASRVPASNRPPPQPSRRRTDLWDGQSSVRFSTFLYGATANACMSAWPLHWSWFVMREGWRARCLPVQWNHPSCARGSALEASEKGGKWGDYRVRGACADVRLWDELLGVGRLVGASTPGDAAGAGRVAMFGAPGSVRARSRR